MWVFLRSFIYQGVSIVYCRFVGVVAGFFALSILLNWLVGRENFKRGSA